MQSPVTATARYELSLLTHALFALFAPALLLGQGFHLLLINLDLS